MPSDPSFSDLMAQLQSRDNDAASKVFQRFAGRLIALAYQRLDPRIRQKLDAEDVVQSVFRSFFGHRAAGELGGLESWHDLWALLIVMTVRKCHREERRFYADRRDVRREVRLTALADESEAGWEICDREPTPAEGAVLAETINELFQEFEGRPGEILLLLLADHTAPEISFRIGCTERTVYRNYKHVEEWLRCHAN